jgi:Cell wall-active antibiotics response 4TMS YvqF
MVAIMGGSRRRGRFRTEGSVNSIAIMGGDEIDLREAEIEGGHLMLNMFALMGGTTLYVPDSIDVEVSGFSLLGGNTEIGSQRPPRPGAPVIQIRTYNLMGGATIYRLPPQARGLSLKEARRLAKAADRGELPAPAEYPPDPGPPH